MRAEPEPQAPRVVALLFLKLGFIAFGEPPAHVDALTAVVMPLSLLAIWRPRLDSAWLVIGGGVVGIVARLLGATLGTLLCYNSRYLVDAMTPLERNSRSGLGGHGTARRRAFTSDCRESTASHLSARGWP